MGRVGAAVLAGVFFTAIAPGCAGPAPTPGSRAATTPVVATHPADHPRAVTPTTKPFFPTAALDEKSLLTLDQITPVPELPKPRARTTTGQPPLDALQAFARARDALASGQRATATTLLEKAIAVDPDSPELYEELGRAYGGQEKSAWAYEQALELDPDNIEIRQRLGRNYLLKNKLDESLNQLRLATQTTDYKEDDEPAAVVDFFLARVLQRKGYDRAALDVYAKLARRLEKPITQRAASADLLTLQTQPELVYAQMGELYEKFGQWNDAVKAYDIAANRGPENFDVQARLTRALLGAGRPRESEAKAAELVIQFKANSESLKLLRDVFIAQGRENQITSELLKMQKAKPNERALLFAVAEALKTDGRGPEAEAMLLDAAHRFSDGVEILRRVFDLYLDRNDTEGAVRLLVRALADNPDSLRQLSTMWAELLKPSRSNPVRLPMLQKLKVEPKAEASRLFWVSRVAELWDRDALARSALEQGAALKPPFAPIYRALVADYWSRPDWDEAAKSAASDKLVHAVREEGNAALAAELDGLSLLNQTGKAEEAAARLAESVRLGNKAPDVYLTQARAAKLAGNASKSESLIWKVVSDNPTYEDAYVDLFNEYLSRGEAGKAINVLGRWLSADPSNVRARVLRARVMQRGGQGMAAESELLSLFHDQPDSAPVLAALFDYFLDTRRVDEFVSRLEEERKAHPANRVAAEQLATIYHQRKQQEKALRVLESTRKSVAGDADLMYYVAHVYGRIGEKETEEEILAEVVKLDPKHAPASNDLGYTWADGGKNLSRAEELLRVAVDAEPDNQSFLDSMGWVLYKRGKFGEARVFFERAIGPATRPDPVVLDHMGDVLYRLSENDGAVKQWKRAVQRLDELATITSREDLKKLRLVLIQKLKQHEQGQPVEVAPTAEGSSAAKVTTQAKN